jgi:hypothetical protein
MIESTENNIRQSAYEMPSMETSAIALVRNNKTG